MDDIIVIKQANAQASAEAAKTELLAINGDGMRQTINTEQNSDLRPLDMNRTLPEASTFNWKSKV